MNCVSAPPTTPPFGGFSFNETVNVREMMEGLVISSPEINPLKNTLSPELYSVSPPLMDFEDELVWFDLTAPSYHQPAYDVSNDVGFRAKRLIEQAFTQALTLHDQQFLLDELKKDPNLVYQIGLTPMKVNIL